MSTSLKWVTLIGAAVLTGALLVALLVGISLAQGLTWWGPRDGFGWGGYGPGGMMGGDMMGEWGYGYYGAGSRLTLDQAAEAAERYLAAYGDSNLVLGEVMEFSDGFYAQAVEEETDIGAFEILIDPASGDVYPEPGPNMMWNTKYGHMGGYGGMMGGYGYQRPTGEMNVGPEEAVQAAHAYLDRVQPGLTADDHADPFYGYYTLHVLRDDQVVGMLSVNGTTSQVWYHTWHGNLIGMNDRHEE